MEKKRKTKIRKWDEVGGIVETEIEESAGTFDEMPGAGPSISRDPLKGVEDMLEQNDNQLDGTINNLPEDKPVCQKNEADVIEEEQKKKSVLKKLQEAAPAQEKEKTVSGCVLCGELERS